MTHRQIQGADNASQIIHIDTREAAAPGHIQLRARSYMDSPVPMDIVVDAGEFAKELDSILPGFHASYRPARVGDSAPKGPQYAQPVIDEAIKILESNGYTVEKKPDPGRDYVNDLMSFAGEVEGTRGTYTDGEQVKLIQLLDALAEHRLQSANVEIYVELDRALIIDTIKAAGGDPDLVAGGPLWTALWPVIIRVDEGGDFVLHATSGERVQFGEDELHGSY